MQPVFFAEGKILVLGALKRRLWQTVHVSINESTGGGGGGGAARPPKQNQKKKKNI